MNAYEQKQEERRQRYLEMSAKAASAANNRFNSHNVRVVAGLQGEPIKIGHHSEHRHRRLLEKADNDMRKGCELAGKADYYEQKAASVGKCGISSDDPDAIVKLKEKLGSLEALQERMKQTNKLLKKNDVEGLKAIGYTDSQINQLKTPDFCGRIGFPGYALTNNNANIHRIRQRIEVLERQATKQPVEVEHKGYIYKEEDNRCQFVFDDKPSEEIRNILKQNSFKWSPSRGAWVRQLTANGKWAAKRVIEQLKGIC